MSLDKKRTLVIYLLDFQQEFKKSVINTDEIKIWCIKRFLSNDERNQLYDECERDDFNLLYNEYEFNNYKNFIQKLDKYDNYKKYEYDYISYRNTIEMLYSFLIYKFIMKYMNTKIK